MTRGEEGDSAVTSSPIAPHKCSCAILLLSAEEYGESSQETCRPDGRFYLHFVLVFAPLWCCFLVLSIEKVSERRLFVYPLILLLQRPTPWPP